MQTIHSNTREPAEENQIVGEGRKLGRPWSLVTRAALRHNQNLHPQFRVSLHSKFDSLVLAAKVQMCLWRLENDVKFQSLIRF